MVSYLLWRSSHAVVTRSFYVTNYLWCSGWRDTGHTRHTWRPSVVRSWEAAPETNERQGMRSSEQSEGAWLRYQGELDTRPVKVAAELVSAGVWLWLWYCDGCDIVTVRRGTPEVRGLAGIWKIFKVNKWNEHVTHSYWSIHSLKLFSRNVGHKIRFSKLKKQFVYMLRVLLRVIIRKDEGSKLYFL